MRIAAVILFIFVILSAGSGAAQAAPQTRLVLNSQTGDYVGGGKRVTYTDADGTFTAQKLSGGVRVSFNSTGGSHCWNLEFVAKSGKAFVAQQYEDAERAAFHRPLKPGLDVYGDGRGCNRLTGRFLVSEVVIDSGGNVQSLAVDFEQHCEGAKPALYGSIRFNSETTIVPRISVGDTFTLKGNAGTSDAAIVASLSMPSSVPLSAYFATRDQTARWGKDYLARTGRVTFAPGETALLITVPIIGNRIAKEDLSFAIKLRPAGTLIGDHSADVNIIDPNGPITALTMNSRPGDYIGEGKSWLRTTGDSVFSVARTYDNGVNFSANPSGDWNVVMAAADKKELTSGVYGNAQRWPFQSAGHPGLSVYGNGRGCNTLTGRFVINAAEYEADRRVKVFSADFEQHCETIGPALFGSVRINAILHQASVTNATISGSTARFVVTLNPPGTKDEWVTFGTVTGTAEDGVDFTAVTRRLKFEPGQTRKVVSVPLLAGARAGKTFFGRISSYRTPVWIGGGSATIQ